MIDLSVPLHMDRDSRARRLYENLLAVGLIVDPVRDDRGEIDHLVVRVDLPAESPDDGGLPGVRRPVLGPQVANVVGSAEGGGDNVAVFPAVRR